MNEGHERPKSEQEQAAALSDAGHTTTGGIVAGLVAGRPVEVLENAGQAALGLATGSPAQAGTAVLGSLTNQATTALGHSPTSLGVPPEVASAGMNLATNFAQQGLGAATSLLSQVLGKEPLPKVDYTLDLADAPPLLWQVRRVHLSEALSEPYELELEIVTADLDADTDALLGASIELKIARDVLVRPICAIIYQVETLGVAYDRLQVRVKAGPALHLLGQRVDTRLWQHATVPEVLREVLSAALADYERGVNIDGLRASYQPREYIVQYRESDRDFVHRLMEEEGITYWFDHVSGQGKEVLMLEDSNDNYGDVETVDDDPGLRIIVNQADNAEIESIQEFCWSRELSSTAIDQRIFNWLDPLHPLHAHAPTSGPAADERGRVREVYHHGHFVEPDPQPRTIRKLIPLRQRDKLARGRGNVTGLFPGRKFELVEHPRPELAQEYLIRRIIHTGDCPEVIQGEAPPENPRYQSCFECMVFDPDDPYRPPHVTARPRIYGPQTALVTGPAGEEIHTDEHGRVKVLFSWDRVHAPSDDTSMWIRVAHHWAGPGFGTFFVPRIGMEVVVEFIEGDPAKPLINGCVYNGANAISVGVPDNKTQSTIRSKSSPASDGYNEIRFEDAAGGEEIFLHAQKDFNETVENDHTTTVHNNQMITVDVDQTTTVSGNQSTTVSKNQTDTVSGNQTNTVSKNQSETVSGEVTLTVEKNRTVTIKGSQAVTILGSQGNSGVNGSKLGITGDYKVDATKTIEVQAPTHILLTCGGSSIKLEPGKITLIAGDAASLVLDANALMVSSDGSQMLLDANVLAASSKASAVLLDANVLVASSDGSQVFLDCNAAVSSPGEASVSAPLSKLSGGGGSVEANSAGVTVSGGQVDISASGVATIAGAMVKIN